MRKTHKDTLFIKPFVIIHKLFISSFINGNPKYIPLFLQIAQYAVGIGQSAVNTTEFLTAYCQLITKN